ncbi:hypothetical protein BVE84_08255 [Streptococcus azizii]|uniref:Uncharacterized protein n=1 Tax=Streptococcus azizii TaxID=1579424 RepID=A0AB36JNP1_9STRE|nr:MULTISPECIES: hypothetical protein [Streptococcus]ONK25452.1 hypothetical protein BVE86_10275 [Streptococcus azizii]ONK25537.1 hypothetical protein BVE85_09950 [Streptococcus azizii]ONK27189.1 hypothetical protein BVE84_08255 [Streptococcus azizii]
MDKISMLIEEFENEATGDTVEGITILIDGKLKDVVDILKNKLNQKESVNIIHEALLVGLEELSHR